MTETLYRSENLLVRTVPAGDESIWAVTFDHYRNEGGLDREGFGEEFLRERGISAIHFLCRGNDWYQYDDLLTACAAARTRLCGVRRVATYGSSMGAYAAIRMADALGATAVLALAPQYSIDPAKVPWERRWLQDGADIAWRKEIDGPIRCAAIPYVVFDPISDDLRHVEQIERDIAIHRIAIPFGRHPVTTYLSDTGLLAPLTLSVLTGEGDPIGLMRAGRARRKTSAFYLAELARAQPASRLKTAAALARRSVEIAESPLALLSLAQINTRSGLHEEAYAVFERIMEITGRDASYIYPYAEARHAGGDLAGALALAAEIIEALPGRAHLFNWQAGFLLESGNQEGAIASLCKAVALDPRQDYIERLKAALAFGSEPVAPSPPPPRLSAAAWFWRRFLRRARRQGRSSLRTLSIATATAPWRRVKG
jgi:tetratricopeptide (TPR) repeat protein